MLGLACALALAGCTSPTLIEGSTVTVALSSPFFSLNDRTSFGDSPANSAVLQAVSSSFNRYDDSSRLAVDSSFGTYRLLSNDPLTVKYTIADGVTWSDGVPVDAADLLLAWVANSGARNTANVDDSVYRDPDSGRYATPFPDDVVYFDGATSEGLQYATRIPKIGDSGRSLTLVWDNYIVDWPLLLQVGLPAHVVASHALGLPLAADSGIGAAPNAERLADAQAAKDALVDAIRDDDVRKLSAIANFWNSGFDLDAMPDDTSLLVSTGPYTITGFVPSTTVTLTANPRYHGDHSPAFETIRLLFLADPSDHTAALADGTADVVVPRPTANSIGLLSKVRGSTVLVRPGGTYEHFDVQFAGGLHSTFTDPRVREAFLKVIPVGKIGKHVLGSALAGKSKRSSLVDIPGTPGYAATVAANGSERFHLPDLPGAKALLAEAGKPAPVVCILFDPSNPKRVQEYQLIAESAAMAGFVVTNCSSPDWRNLLGTPGTYDASIFAWSSTNLSVAGLQSIFGTNGGGNFNGYSNPTVDSLLSKLAVTFDPEAQRVIRTELDSKLYSDAYGLPLYQEQVLVAHNDRVTGIAPATLAPGILWNVWDWTPVEASTATPQPVK